MTTRSRRAGVRSRRSRSDARTALHALADRLGIVAEYVDQTGKQRRRTSDETRVALLDVMGFPAGTEREARESLERLFAEDRRTIVPRAVVARAGAPIVTPLLSIDAVGSTVSWSISIRDEGGNERAAGGTSSGELAESTTIAYPPDLSPGYYAVTVRIKGAGPAYEAEQLLVVAPPTCPSPGERIGSEGVFGLIANLYTVRSNSNAGFGNFTDLANLARWGGEIGASFVGVNPLHALFNRGAAISPYSPVSRLFRSSLYLDVAALPELADSDDARGMLESPAVDAELASLRRADRIDYERVAATVDPILHAAYRSFADRHRSGSSERWRAFQAYVAGQGRALQDFATFMALHRHLTPSHGRAPGSGATTSGMPGGAMPSSSDVPSWREWPERFRDPRSPAVAEFRERHAEGVQYEQWVQFALDSQLAAAARVARDAGMRVGLYQDLAIGTSPGGADNWANPGLFLPGASIGAPPDPYAETGQVWGLPPLDPRRLAMDGYAYWIDLVRASLRHAGALRIDHVMGLFQQFWVPAGESGTKGAYVRFPATDLLGILALEATRANALVVGEDLGTVPPDVPPAMEEREILSSRVLYFERTKSGGFVSAAKYPRLALATANTHDMATLGGWWTGRDLELRELVRGNAQRSARRSGNGAAANPVPAEARREREKEKRALIRRLAGDGALPSARVPESDVEIRGAVHRFLCMTPSALVGLSLDDLAGEVEPVNLPGVGPDVFPSWTRRMRMSLEDLRRDDGVQRALGCETRT